MDAQLKIMELKEEVQRLQSSELNLLRELEKQERLAHRLSQLESRVKTLQKSETALITELSQNELLTEHLSKLESQIRDLQSSELNLLNQLQESVRQADVTSELESSVQQLAIEVQVQDPQHGRLEEVEERLMCCICSTNQVNVVWIPCGHAKFCAKCDESYKLNGGVTCMLCRQSGKSYKFVL